MPSAMLSSRKQLAHTALGWGKSLSESLIPAAKLSFPGPYGDTAKKQQENSQQNCKDHS